MSKKLYIIAGCNGAGKTTASFNILPSILDCKEFVNADEIARGLSPFQPEKVAFEAGKIMLHRIDELLETDKDFAFETTLATRSFRNTVLKAKERGYIVTLLFFCLENQELAIERVKTRVSEGGHNIPVETIRRRYLAGLKNLFEIYIPICDRTFVFNNSRNNPKKIFKYEDGKQIIYNQIEFDEIRKQ